MYRKLLKSVREYKKATFLAPALVFCEVILEVLMPLIMASIIDKGIDKGDISYIVKMGALLLACALGAMFFGIMAGKYASVSSAGFAKNLRRDMFYNVSTFSFANIDKFSTGSIVTRLTTDVMNVQMAFQMLVRSAIRSPFMLIFSLVSCLLIEPSLAVIYLICTPVLGLGLIFIASKAHPTFERVFKTYDKLNTVVGENLSGIRVVKSFVREEHEKDKFEEVSTSIYKDFSKAEKLLAFNSPLMQLCMYSCMLFISWFGARLIVTSGNDASLGLTTGQFMSFITYSMQILMSLMMFSMIFVMLTISKASRERIAEILDEKSSLTSPENAKTYIADGSIEFRDVDFSYSKDAEKLVLENINLKIRSGETVGILGSTGSSKSSLVSLIPRLYDVCDGAVFVGGTDVREYDLDTLRNNVAMVLQKNVLFSGTIKENLRWGNENATDEEMIHACRLACADEFIQGFTDKYDTYIEQGGTNVSGGQKQRLCIARALLKKPKILILDDSTSAVDTKTDAMIRKAFRDEIPDTTKIIIAQRVASVMDADKIIILDEGKIVGIGDHQTLLRENEIYAEVYTSQMKGGDDDE